MDCMNMNCLENRLKQIQPEISYKIRDLMIEKTNRDIMTRNIVRIHCKSVEEIEEKNIKKIEGRRYTSHFGENANEFENLVHELSNLFLEFRRIEKEIIPEEDRF